MSGNEIRIRAVLDDKVSSGLGKIRDKLDTIGGKGTAGVTFGVVAAKGLGLMEEAAGGVVDILGKAVEAARADEESISNLSASLKANIAGWNGNTTAIESLITAHRSLGFSDEEQRISLAGLVGATHDVTKAFNIQRVAMDLARFKHISLAEAGDALTKVEAGSYRVLKSLGIELKAGATSTEALAAVEKIAAGQAEDFAQTNAGRLLVSQDKVNEAMEKIGYVIMPVVADAMGTVADAAGPLVAGILGIVDAANNLAGVLDFLAGNTDKNAKASSDWLGDNVTPLGRGIHGLAEDIGYLVGQEGELLGITPKVSTVTETATATVNDYGTSLKDVADKGDRALYALTTKIKYAAKETVLSFDEMQKAAGIFRKDLLTDAQSIVTNYFDVIITQDKLAATNAEISAQRRIIASSTASAKEKADARATLHQLQSDQATMLQDLATHGATTSAAFAKSIADLNTKLKTSHGAERDAILAEIRALELLAAKAKIAAGQVLTLNERIAVTLAKGGYVSAAGAKAGKASGGPVGAGQTYTVGEKGPETLVMGGQSGYIIPNGGGSSTVVHTNVYLDGRVIAQVVDEHMASALQRAAPFVGV